MLQRSKRKSYQCLLSLQNFAEVHPGPKVKALPPCLNCKTDFSRSEMSKEQRDAEAAAVSSKDVSS